MNNDLIYNAALAGATGFFSWQGDQSGFEYQQQLATVLSFAGAVDAGIPIDPAMNGSKADLLTAAVLAINTDTLPSLQSVVRTIALYNSLVNTLLPTPLPPVPYVTSQVDYQATLPLVLTVIPAIAPSGIYTVAMSVVNQVPAIAGTIDGLLEGIAPAVIPIEIAFPWNNITIPNTLARFSTWTLPFINGTPLTITSTPFGVTGSPVFDVYCTAERLAPLPA